MDFLSTFQAYLLPFALDILRLCIWLMLLLAIFVPLERLFPIHPQKVFRKSFFLDLTYYFINGLLPTLLLVVPTAFIAWSTRHVIPSGVISWSGHLPLLPKLCASLVVGEFGFYWGHRWTHEIPFLWRFHSIHHGAEEMDWLVSSHAHPLDTVFVRLCGLVPLYTLGLTQPTAGNKLDALPLLILLIGTAWGFFIHSNLRWRFGWLEFVLSTPAFHHWHHTQDEHVDKNYASMLPIMDKLFGTWYVPKHEWPPRYGIQQPLPSGLSGQLLNPFTTLSSERVPRADSHLVEE
jgi:sterol desaturase/sphingolipid hydroxylase (fatty acid hydroxylase superfamily)